MVDEETKERFIGEMQATQASLGRIIFTAFREFDIGWIGREGQTGLPVRIVRQATREEYLAQNRFRATPNEAPIDSFFYEVEVLD